MPSRKQANQLKVGDRFSVQLTLSFETVRTSRSEGDITVEVKPIPCGDRCPNQCDCHYSLLANAAGPYFLRLKENQRLAFMGNLSELLATLERTRVQIKQLQVTQDRHDHSSRATGNG